MKIIKPVLILILSCTFTNVYPLILSDWKDCLTHGVLKETILITQHCAENMNTAPSMDGHTSKAEIDSAPPVITKIYIPHDPACFSEEIQGLDTNIGQ